MKWQEALSRGSAVSSSISQDERVTAAVGLCSSDPNFGRIHYFFYRLGLLPVTSTLDPWNFGITKEAAQSFVKTHGTTLRNDLNSPCGLGRAGDWGKFYIVTPTALSTKQTTGPIFQFSLALLLIAAFLCRSYVLGICLVVFIGSYRFQLYETYFNNNVFSLYISTGVALLALQFKFLSKDSSHPSAIDWALPFISGVVLALSCAIRGDVIAFAGAVVLAYLFSGQRFKRSALLSLIFLLSYALSSTAINQYFAYKVREAREFVLNAGGKITPGGPLKGHPIWYTLAAGLGDFGQDKGFQWSDRKMFASILPEFNQKTGKNYISNGFYFLEEGASEDDWIKPELSADAIEIFRNRILTAITTDPLWYVEILWKRILTVRAAWTSTGVRLFAPSGASTWFYLSSWVLLPILLFALLARDTHHIKLLVFASFFAAIPVLVTSKMGTYNYSIFHLVLAAVTVDAALLLCVHLWQLFSRKVWVPMKTAHVS